MKIKGAKPEGSRGTTKQYVPRYFHCLKFDMIARSMSRFEIVRSIVQVSKFFTPLYSFIEPSLPVFLERKVKRHRANDHYNHHYI